VLGGLATNPLSFSPIALSPHSLLDPPPGSRPLPRRREQRSTSVALIREVLACLDGSDLGRRVVPHAQLVSHVFGARLTLLHVLEAEAVSATHTAPADPLDWGIRQREARAHLEQAVAQFGGPNSKIRSELIQGSPAEQICSWAESHGIDLTVLCSHGARGVTEWDLASTARKLIDKVPGSLFLVPAGVAVQEEKVRYRRILVPLDGSPRAESAISIAMRIAASENAEVIFVHVVSTPEIIRLGPLDAEGSDLERRVIDYNQRVATAYLDRLRAHAAHSNSRVRALVVIDDNVRLKLERMIREENANLVVMSAHGQRCRPDSPCGSVTEYALAHATVPLLVVRERVGRQVRRVASPSSRSVDRAVPVGPAAQ
jgi:nucleotide-binding universal stress UspA family protein